MIILQESELKQIYGGVNVYNSAKIGAQIGGIIGAPTGATLGFAFFVEAARHGITYLSLGFPIAGGFAGFFGGIAAGALIGTSVACMINIAEFTYS